MPRGAGGRDGEAGAAERRLAEALRAQASLSARPTAAPVVHKPAPPKRGTQKGTVPSTPNGTVPGTQKGTVPGTQKGTVPGTQKGTVQRSGGQKPARATASGGQSGPHGRGAAAGHQSGPQLATARPAGASLPPPGRGSGGSQVRARDDQLPTTRVATAEPGAAEAPTTVAPSAPSGPAPRPAGSTPPPARAVLDARLRVALLVGLLAGVLLGCALALLSVLDPGLLPAIA